MASAVNAVVPNMGSRVDVPSDPAGRSEAVEASRPSSGGVDQSAQSSLEIEGIAEALTDRLEQAGGSVNVGIESVNGTVVFTVTDQRTGNVLRKIPSDEALRITRNIDELTGILVDRME
jgi:uncharacterized FlaG/YvyC family protein